VQWHRFTGFHLDLYRDLRRLDAAQSISLFGPVVVRLGMVRVYEHDSAVNDCCGLVLVPG
jgi:hypothetical protein